jgi:putative iron-dependent peroxidase
LDPRHDWPMSTPQGGIFALGTASHAYLEFDVSDGRKAHELVTAISALREPRTTMGGVNLVAARLPPTTHRPSSRGSLTI